MPILLSIGLRPPGGLCRRFFSAEVDCPAFRPYLAELMRGSPTIVAALMGLFPCSTPAQVDIRTTTLPDGVVGQPYALSLEAEGGEGGFVWSADRLFAEVPEPDTEFDFGGTPQHWRGDDGCWGPVPLPFPFPFLGSVYTQCFINTEGTIRFDTCDLDYSGSLEELAEQPKIAVLWSDWWTDVAVSNQTPEDIYLTLTHTSLVVRWQVEGWEAGEVIRADFQATLFADGMIRLAYGDATRRRGLIALSGGRPDRVFVSSLQALPRDQPLGSRVLFPVGGLPEGLHLAPDGRINGTPRGASTNLVSIQVRNAAGQVGAGEWILAIRENPDAAPPGPTVAVQSDFARRYAFSDAVHARIDPWPRPEPAPAIRAPAIQAPAVVDRVSARRYIDLFEMEPRTTDITMHKYALLEQIKVQRALYLFAGQIEKVMEAFKTPINRIPGLPTFMLAQRARSREKNLDPEQARAIERETVQGMGRIISLFHEQKLRDILTERQRIRLDELIIQMRGPILLALLDPLADQVELDAMERAAVAQLVRVGVAEIAPRVKGLAQVLEGAGAASAEGIARAASLRRALQERDAAILAALRPQQRALFEKLQGRPLPLNWDVAKLLGLPFK